MNTRGGVSRRLVGNSPGKTGREKDSKPRNKFSIRKGVDLLNFLLISGSCHFKIMYRRLAQGFGWFFPETEDECQDVAV